MVQIELIDGVTGNKISIGLTDIIRMTPDDKNGFGNTYITLKQGDTLLVQHRYQELKDILTRYGYKFVTPSESKN